MSENIRISLYFSIGSIISFVIVVNNNVDSTAAGFIVLFSGLASAVVFMLLEERRRASPKKYLSYDVYTKTLTLKERNPANANVIKVERMMDYNLKYHPSEIVYTGVTVGGIHTGGFHDRGNYISIDGKRTQKYRLIYNGVGVTSEQSCPIEIIKLEGNLTDKAKNNSLIRQYLDSNGMLVLKNNVKSENAQFIVSAMEVKNIDAAMEFAKEDYYNQQLTKEQCDSVKNWICSK